MTARDRTVLIVVGVLALIVGSWFLIVQPKRAQASKLGDEISSAQSQLDSARATVAAGEAAKHSFAASYTTMARLGEAVPADDQVPSLIFQVQAAASATNVAFGSLTLNPTSSSAPAAAGASAAASPGTSAAPLPPGVSVGPAGFPSEPFTFTFTGNFFSLSSFIGRLERFVTATNRRIAISGRLMSLNAISLGAGPKGFPQIIATIAATTYMLPAAQGVQAGASTAGPAGTPGAQPISTPGSTSTVAPAAISAASR